MSTFQSILLGVFVVAIIAGLLMFGVLNKNSNTQTATITIWGTLSSDAIKSYVNDLNQTKKYTVNVVYVQHDEETFDTDLLKALADGNGPDAVLIDQTQILQNQNRVYTIPYSTYKLRDFKDAFVQEGELFLNPQGVLAFPFVVDPIVMYWNRDLLSAEGIATPPRYWDEFLQLVPKLTKRDSSLNISQSAVALGEFVNIANAKDILATMILQSGNQIVVMKNAQYETILSSLLGFSIAPAQAALNFYTEFSDPTKETYSWNRSFPSSLEKFISGDLAMYFGYASELQGIRTKNPNLNFDVSYFPQPRQNPEGAITFGRMFAFAVLKSSKNPSDALSTIETLTSTDAMTIWQQNYTMSSARRDVLSSPSEDAYKDIFNNSVIRARGWLDPDKRKTTKIFQDMIESVVSGKNRVNEAVDQASVELNALLK